MEPVGGRFEVLDTPDAIYAAALAAAERPA